jgi:CxxC motif-containing protein
MKREITCIVCPRGCRMTADVQGETITVTGHTCPRGEKHAMDEILHPSGA